MTETKPFKPFPILRTDEEAEHFLDTADLSEYDFSDFEPAHQDGPPWKHAAVIGNFGPIPRTDLNDPKVIVLVEEMRRIGTVRRLNVLRKRRDF